MKFICALILLCTTAHAAEKTFVGTESSTKVSIEEIKGSTQFYIKVVSPELGDDRVYIANRTPRSGDTEEEYLVKGLDFSIELGGRFAKPKAKIPTAGRISFGEKRFDLKIETRAEDLASEYAQSECLAANKTTSQSEIDKAMTEAKSTCGVSFTVAVDWPSFGNSGSACNFRETLGALTEVCKDADFKKAVASLKTFRVSAGVGEALTKNGSAVNVKVPALPVNTKLNSKTWFENHL